MLEPLWIRLGSDQRLHGYKTGDWLRGSYLFRHAPWLHISLGSEEFSVQFGALCHTPWAILAFVLSAVREVYMSCNGVASDIHMLF